MMSWWWGPSWFGMPFWPILMMVVMVVFCMVMMSMMMHGKGMQPPWRRFSRGAGKAARDILDERYASGEIDKAEYEDRRRDLMA
jgi:putative membrane protein